MKLIDSDDWNFLSYPRSHCLTGKDIFGNDGKDTLGKDGKDILGNFLNIH